MDSLPDLPEFVEIHATRAISGHWLKQTLSEAWLIGHPTRSSILYATAPISLAEAAPLLIDFKQQMTLDLMIQLIVPTSGDGSGWVHVADSKLPESAAEVEILPRLTPEDLRGWPSIDRIDIGLFGEFGPFMVLRRKGFLASYAYSWARTQRFAGMTVATHPSFWRQGLARDVCNTLMAWLLDQSLTPVWRALNRNVASMKLAESLGFRRHQPFIQLIPE